MTEGDQSLKLGPWRKLRKGSKKWPSQPRDSDIIYVLLFHFYLDQHTQGSKRVVWSFCTNG